MNYRKANLKDEYLKQSVFTASPAELIVMLFDACIKNLKLADILLNEDGRIGDAGLRLSKAQEIIGELIASLNSDIPLSQEILPVYQFLLTSIRDMNLKKDLTQLPGILEVLESMRDTWEQVAKTAVRYNKGVSVG
ncbi:MAG TPA: flagellar export chaperone FliS [Papillibacter sp.]|jgi:flagellar protein FliS|nr:flagellar export chaperone FliS [Papillibacter sp.]